MGATKLKNDMAQSYKFNTDLILACNNWIPGYIPYRNSYTCASGKIYMFVPRSTASIIKQKKKKST